MTPNKELLSLASRVEALDGPSREVDAEIARAIGFIVCPEPDRPSPRYYGHGISRKNKRNLPRFTASCDAAIELYARLPKNIASNPRVATARALRQRATIKLNADKQKPCPNCGSTHTFVLLNKGRGPEYKAACGNCDTEVIRSTKSDALTAWNRLHLRARAYAREAGE